MDEGMRPSFERLQAEARAIWAKSDTGRGHGLLAHLLDVGAVADAILQLEPPATRDLVSEAFGVETEHVGRWVAAVAGLHDFGKCIPGFQAKWLEGHRLVAECGLPFKPAALRHDNHSLATAALLTPLLEQMSGAARAWCLHVVQAVSAHHGYHFLAAQVDSGKPRHEGSGWEEARRAILLNYWDTLAPRGQPAAPHLTLPIVNWLAGLTSAADWIASNPAWFPMGERRDSLDDYYADARRLADRALQKIGWTAYRPLLGNPDDIDALLARVAGQEGLRARPLQRGGDELLRAVQGPALLLVEAPMGEGKTELAFLAHLRLQAANQHRGLYVALPTQATGNALFRRAQTFLKAFATESLDMQLVHGGAAMNADLAVLRDVDHSAGETLSASAWFGQRRRPLLSPYGVGTVDQALYAVLNVKHHFVRLWGLSNRVVVLDEVHAYDTYTVGLIATLLRWLKALRCSVVLMSATLPRARCQELLAAWGADPQWLPALDYPRLVLVDDAGARGVHVAARPLAGIELSGFGSDIEALANAAVAGVTHGGCGAVIVNTVSRAQALYLALQARLEAAGQNSTELVLFHARFPANERAAHEDRVLSLFGPEGERPRRALLVATQVAEQSLDIDFDFMLSDLAPVDLLLQRAGRLHRHNRPRPPAHAQARLRVAGLLPGALPEMKQTAWGFVYEPYVLGRTWALLTRETLLQLPQDIDRLVQAVYDVDHPLPEGLEEEARAFIEGGSFGEHLAKVKTERMQAFSIAIDPAAEPHDAYNNKPHGHEEDELGLGLKNSTRLGPDSVTLVPVLVGEDGRWHVQAGDDGFLPDKLLDPATARALYNRQVKVSRKGIVQRLKTLELPTAFTSHALLRNMVPLRLVSGSAIDPGLHLTLSPDLGLVFDAPDRPHTTTGDA